MGFTTFLIIELREQTDLYLTWKLFTKQAHEKSYKVPRFTAGAMMIFHCKHWRKKQTNTELKLNI